MKNRFSKFFGIFMIVLLVIENFGVALAISESYSQSYEDSPIGLQGQKENRFFIALGWIKDKIENLEFKMAITGNSIYSDIVDYFGGDTGGTDTGGVGTNYGGDCISDSRCQGTAGTHCNGNQLITCYEEMTGCAKVSGEPVNCPKLCDVNFNGENACIECNDDNDCGNQAPVCNRQLDRCEQTNEGECASGSECQLTDADSACTTSDGEDGLKACMKSGQFCNWGTCVANPDDGGDGEDDDTTCAPGSECQLGSSPQLCLDGINYKRCTKISGNFNQCSWDTSDCQDDDDDCSENNDEGCSSNNIGENKCSGTAIEQCQQDGGDGCYYWVEQEDCSDNNQKCSSNAGTTSCVECITNNDCYDSSKPTCNNGVCEEEGCTEFSIRCAPGSTIGREWCFANSWLSLGFLDCGSNQHCQDGSCIDNPEQDPNCQNDADDGCTANSISNARCSGTIVQACQRDSQGSCHSWGRVSDCNWYNKNCVETGSQASCVERTGGEGGGGGNNCNHQCANVGASCSNGILTRCSTGNDGCRLEMTVNCQYGCNSQNNECNDPPAECGNGIVETGEVCERGNTNPEGCNNGQVRKCANDCKSWGACEDECSSDCTYNYKECSGNNAYKICNEQKGTSPSDPCFGKYTWASPISCLNGQTCSGQGICSAVPADDKCANKPNRCDTLNQKVCVQGATHLSYASYYKVCIRDSDGCLVLGNEQNCGWGDKDILHNGNIFEKACDNGECTTCGNGVCECSQMEADEFAPPVLTGNQHLNCGAGVTGIPGKEEGNDNNGENVCSKCSGQDAIIDSSGNVVSCSNGIPSIGNDNISGGAGNDNMASGQEDNSAQVVAQKEAIDKLNSLIQEVIKNPNQENIDSLRANVNLAEKNGILSSNEANSILNPINYTSNVKLQSGQTSASICGNGVCEEGEYDMQGYYQNQPECNPIDICSLINSWIPGDPRIQQCANNGHIYKCYSDFTMRFEADCFSSTKCSEGSKKGTCTTDCKNIELSMQKQNPEIIDSIKQISPSECSCPIGKCSDGKEYQKYSCGNLGQCNEINYFADPCGAMNPGDKITNSDVAVVEQKGDVIEKKAGPLGEWLKTLFTGEVISNSITGNAISQTQSTGLPDGYSFVECAKSCDLCSPGQWLCGNGCQSAGAGGGKPDNCQDISSSQPAYQCVKAEEGCTKDEYSCDKEGYVPLQYDGKTYYKQGKNIYQTTASCTGKNEPVNGGNGCCRLVDKKCPPSAEMKRNPSRALEYKTVYSITQGKCIEVKKECGSGEAAKESGDYCSKDCEIVGADMGGGGGNDNNGGNGADYTPVDGESEEIGEPPIAIPRVKLNPFLPDDSKWKADFEKWRLQKINSDLAKTGANTAKEKAAEALAAAKAKMMDDVSLLGIQIKQIKELEVAIRNDAILNRLAELDGRTVNDIFNNPQGWGGAILNAINRNAANLEISIDSNDRNSVFKDLTGVTTQENIANAIKNTIGKQIEEKTGIDYVNDKLQNIQNYLSPLWVPMTGFGGAFDVAGGALQTTIGYMAEELGNLFGNNNLKEWGANYYEDGVKWQSSGFGQLAYLFDFTDDRTQNVKEFAAEWMKNVGLNAQAKDMAASTQETLVQEGLRAIQTGKEGDVVTATIMGGLIGVAAVTSTAAGMMIQGAVGSGVLGAFTGIIGKALGGAYGLGDKIDDLGDYTGIGKQLLDALTALTSSDFKGTSEDKARAVLNAGISVLGLFGGMKLMGKLSPSIQLSDANTAVENAQTKLETLKTEGAPTGFINAAQAELLTAQKNLNNIEYLINYNNYEKIAVQAANAINDKTTYPDFQQGQVISVQIPSNDGKININAEVQIQNGKTQVTILDNDGNKVGDFYVRDAGQIISSGKPAVETVSSVGQESAGDSGSVSIGTRIANMANSARDAIRSAIEGLRQTPNTLADSMGINVQPALAARDGERDSSSSPSTQSDSSGNAPRTGRTTEPANVVNNDNNFAEEGFGVQWAYNAAKEILAKEKINSEDLITLQNAYERLATEQKVNGATESNDAQLIVMIGEIDFKLKSTSPTDVNAEPSLPERVYTLTESKISETSSLPQGLRYIEINAPALEGITNPVLNPKLEALTNAENAYEIARANYEKAIKSTTYETNAQYISELDKALSALESAGKIRDNADKAVQEWEMGRALAGEREARSKFIDSSDASALSEAIAAINYNKWMEARYKGDAKAEADAAINFWQAVDDYSAKQNIKLDNEIEINKAKAEVVESMNAGKINFEQAMKFYDVLNNKLNELDIKIAQEITDVTTDNVEQAVKEAVAKLMKAKKLGVLAKLKEANFANAQAGSAVPPLELVGQLVVNGLRNMGKRIAGMFGIETAVNKVEEPPKIPENAVEVEDYLNYLKTISPTFRLETAKSPNLEQVYARVPGVGMINIAETSTETSATADIGYIEGFTGKDGKYTLLHTHPIPAKEQGHSAPEVAGRGDIKNLFIIPNQKTSIVAVQDSETGKVLGYSFMRKTDKAKFVYKLSPSEDLSWTKGLKLKSSQDFANDLDQREAQWLAANPDQAEFRTDLSKIGKENSEDLENFLDKYGVQFKAVPTEGYVFDSVKGFVPKFTSNKIESENTASLTKFVESDIKAGNVIVDNLREMQRQGTVKDIYGNVITDAEISEFSNAGTTTARKVDILIKYGLSAEDFAGGVAVEQQLNADEIKFRKSYIDEVNNNIKELQAEIASIEKKRKGLQKGVVPNEYLDEFDAITDLNARLKDANVRLSRLQDNNKNINLEADNAVLAYRQIPLKVNDAKTLIAKAKEIKTEAEKTQLTLDLINVAKELDALTETIGKPGSQDRLITQIKIEVTKLVGQPEIIAPKGEESSNDRIAQLEKEKERLNQEFSALYKDNGDIFELKNQADAEKADSIQKRLNEIDTELEKLTGKGELDRLLESAMGRNENVINVNDEQKKKAEILIEKVKNRENQKEALDEIFKNPKPTNFNSDDVSTFIHSPDDENSLGYSQLLENAGSFFAVKADFRNPQSIIDAARAAIEESLAESVSDAYQFRIDNEALKILKERKIAVERQIGENKALIVTGDNIGIINRLIKEGYIQVFDQNESPIKFDNTPSYSSSWGQKWRDSIGLSDKSLIEQIILDRADEILTRQVEYALEDTLKKLPADYTADEFRGALKDLNSRLRQRLPFIGEANIDESSRRGTDYKQMFVSYLKLFLNGPQRLSGLSSCGMIDCVGQSAIIQQALGGQNSGWVIANGLVSSSENIRTHAFLYKIVEIDGKNYAAVIDPSESDFSFPDSSPLIPIEDFGVKVRTTNGEKILKYPNAIIQLINPLILRL